MLRRNSQIVAPGDTFGAWTVLAIEVHGQYRRAECRCQCGATVRVLINSLVSGRSGRCQACRRRDREKNAVRTTPEYGIWTTMRARCSNPRATDYARYGGRGITVAAEWCGVGGFARFFAHVGKRPSPRHSIDRIKNDKGYEPGNVRWATPSEQNQNRRDNRLLTVDGRTLCVAEWERETGTPRHVIYYRIDRGWPADRAVKTPPRARRKPRSRAA